MTSIDIDSETHDVWLGTLGGGLARFTGGRFDVFDQLNSGLAGNLVFAVALGEGRVFAATNGGVSVFEPAADQWDLLDPRTSDRVQPAVVGLTWSTGALYARLWPDGFGRWDVDERVWKPCFPIAFDDPRDVAGAIAKSSSKSPPPGPPAVAVLGPGTRRMPLPGDESAARRVVAHPDVVAVQATLAPANRAARGSGEDEFILSESTPGYARYGWGLLEDDLVVYADRPGVLGVIAHLNGGQRFTEAAASFLGLPLVNIAAESGGVRSTEPADRWVFRCRGSGPRRHRALLDAVVEQDRCTRWTVVTPTSNEEARVRTRWTIAYARDHGLPEPSVVTWDDPPTESVGAAAAAATRTDAEAVMFWGDAQRAAELLRGARAGGWNGLFVGGESLVAGDLAATIGADAGSVIALAPDDRRESCPPAFRVAYREAGPPDQSAEAPDELACRTHQAADHVLAAIRIGGADRDAVRRALLNIEESAAGERHLQAFSPSPPAVTIARLHAGRWRYEPASLPTRAP